MAELETRHFGKIEYQQESAIEFPAGIPGFEDERRFVFIEQPGMQPLAFLQSLSQPDLCFLTLPARAIDPDYRLDIASEDLAELGLAPDRQPEIGPEILCVAIVSLAEGEAPTANLLSPMVVNLKNRRGLQAIQQGSRYSHRHPLIPPAPEASCS